MRRSYRKPGDGMAAGTLLFLIVFLIILIFLGIRIFSNQAPTIQLKSQIKGIGQSTPIQASVLDEKHSIKSVTVEVEQNGQVFRPNFSRIMEPAERRPWWKFWGARPPSKWSVSARVGQKEIPGLKEGRAKLLIIASNNSWGRFFRGGRSELWLDLPVRFTPPQVEVLSSQVYVHQGGSGMVVFKVSPPDAESGVQLGNTFFRSYPVPASAAGTRLCLFAFPYDEDPAAPLHLEARDDAGNETLASFSYKVFPGKFQQSILPVTDAFMQRVVPPIMSESRELKDRGNLLQNFLEINGWLREHEAQELVALASQTRPKFLWTQAFVPLPNAKVETPFADRRTYVYQGRVVDHQTHLGFDLASVEHAAVVAANDGVVVMARYFGIYGNAIVIDHGCGLQSLYGHLESFTVKVGDHVQRGQVIGHTDSTGLAAGDHLHFTMLVNGIPVNPMEWWDPHWIHDQILMKLTATRQALLFVCGADDGGVREVGF